MAILLKKLLQPLQMSAVTIQRAVVFSTRNCSQESTKIYNTIRGTLSHHFADSSYYEHDILIRKVPKFLDIDLIQVDKLINSLKAFGYTWNDIMKNPRVVLLPSYQILYKMQLIKEFGFNHPKLHDLLHCTAVMNSEISFLKFYGSISEDRNVLHHFWENIKPLELPQTVFEEAKERYPEIESTTLRELYIHFLKHYLSERFNVEIEKIEVFLKKNRSKKGPQMGPSARVVYKGLGSYPAICDTLLNNLQYDFTHVSTYPSLLNIYPNSVLKLLAEFPKIGGSSIYDIALEFPDVLLIPVENIKQWITLLEKYKVTHFKVTKATIRLFLTGHYKAVEERLYVLSLHQELKMICYSDKFFKVLNRPFGVKRLAEVLSSDQPLKSVNSTLRLRVTLGKPKLRIPSELVNYIAQELDLDKEEARRLLNLPNFVHFGLSNSNLIIGSMKEYGFSREQIINGIEIISFKYSEVNEALKSFSKNPDAQPFTEWMENPYVLNLLMYLIRKNGLYS